MNEGWTGVFDRRTTQKKEDRKLYNGFKMYKLKTNGNDVKIGNYTPSLYSNLSVICFQLFKEKIKQFLTDCKRIFLKHYVIYNFFL